MEKILAKGLAQIVAGEIAKKSRIVFQLVGQGKRGKKVIWYFQDFVSELRSQETAVNVQLHLLKSRPGEEF